MPPIFNLIVDNVVSNCLELMVEDKLVTQEVLGMATGRFLGLLYAGNGVLELWDPEWIQGAMNVLIGLFRR